MDIQQRQQQPFAGAGALMTSSPRGSPILGRSLEQLVSAPSSHNLSKASVSSPSKSSKTSRGFTLSLGEDENKERGNWSGKLDFILSSIGYAVGLGNVWRFPYLCYRNGGGAFLIPYAIMLAFAGLPLLYLELALGQFASQGPISIWKISPLFKGIGYAMMTVGSICSTYYNVIIAYTIFYFFASLTSEVPWKHCEHDWNSNECTAFGNVSKINFTASGTRPRSPAEDYWERYVLDISPGIEHPGTIRWQLALCLLCGWVVVFLCLIKGIKSTGKVVYFTALFPYVVLVILFIRGVTLPGCIEGIKFYIIPDFKKLGSARVWGQAAIQIFYSLGPAWGGMLTMSSYNRFHNNCYRDAIIISVVNCGTSVFAGFVIFSVLGFMSKEFNVPVAEVADSGPGLAFVAYPAGLSMMPAAPFWSAVFFFMLFTLGLDSQFAGIEAVISAFADEYPDHVRPYKSLFTLGICILFFMLGLPQVTQGGVYWMNLLDWYAVGFSLLIIGLLEVIVVVYIYGYSRFAEDIRSMIGFTPNRYWALCWCFLTPLSIVIIIVFYCILYEPVTYNDKPYPAWAEVVGWLTVAAAIIWIPVWMVIKFFKYIGGCQELKKLRYHLCSLETLRSLTSPAYDWGPALLAHRRLREKAVQTQTVPEMDITIDTIDFKLPYQYNRGFDNSAFSSKSDLTMFETYV